MRLPDSLLDDCLCDPSAPLGHDPARDYGLGKPQAQTQLAGLKEWLREQQSMLMANRQDALLLVLQGPDCAGKNGVVRRVLAGLDPLGMSAIGFQAPTPDERREGFLQRYRERLPAPGTLGVFNRSYYEALVSDVRDGLCAVADLPQRYGAIAEFEQRMHAQRINPLKCYLQLSLGEQKRRLHRRLDHPEKRWKDPGRSARPSPLRRSPGAMGRGAGAHPPRRGALVRDSCRSSLAARPYRRQPAGP